MNKTIWIILTLFSGASLPIQAGLNSKLAKAAQNPIYASLISFLVGALGIIAYILLTRQTMSWTSIKEAPIHLWLGGLLGAFYVTVIVLSFPILGPGLTFGLVVAGQMIISLVLDHFNILVAQQNPISLTKVLGVMLVVAGVVLIRRN